MCDSIGSVGGWCSCGSDCGTCPCNDLQEEVKQ